MAAPRKKILFVTPPYHFVPAISRQVPLPCSFPVNFIHFIMVVFYDAMFKFYEIVAAFLTYEFTTLTRELLPS